ncbi:MAG: DUF21 domain-containing protein [Bradyrhizobiaceae bacterium]|nr:DUF21 domain-containing protein [Bradyrhizobiaceae bacterium]
MDILALILGIVVSAFCEYLTAALLNLRQSVLSTMADEGSAVGEHLHSAYENSDETALSISVVDMIAMSACAASLVFIAEFDLGRTLLFITGLLVVLSTAKVVASAAGTRYASHMLSLTSTVFRVVHVVAYPVILVHRILLKFTQHETDEEEAREELEALVETAREEGALDAGEYRIMTNIMQLSSIVVADVMTPRTVVSGLPQMLTIEEALKRPELQMYSRFPVYEGQDPDGVVGYVIAKDILRAALAGRMSTEVAKLKRPVHFIPENITLERALEQFLQQRQHMFMVVDEHGGVEGLITMEDVMETMLGVEIVDEADHVVDLRQLAKQRRDARIAEREALIAPNSTTA